MGSETGKKGRGVVAIAAAWLHAFVLLASLVLVPADPLFKTYENAATMALADQAPDEAVEKKSAGGDDHSLWSLSQRDEVSLRLGERLCHSQEAPRVSGCGRSFHARGPPALRA
ncbi:MAG: hypothetical protein RIQ68_2378 [Pseudomonadota bacterium]|jgi:hypothetical protein